jgi:hypothetical protein
MRQWMAAPHVRVGIVIKIFNIRANGTRPMVALRYILVSFLHGAVAVVSLIPLHIPRLLPIPCFLSGSFPSAPLHCVQILST